MTPLALLIRAGIPARLAKAVLIAGTLTVLAIALLVMSKLHDRRVIADHEATITRQVSEDRAKAAEAAADARARDVIAAEQTRKDLTDAGKNLPDARPSDRRRALGCERLRRAGTDPDRLPAECRPGG